MYAGKKALTSFGDDEVVIPFVVIEELEKKRIEDGLVGSMARLALREIDNLREEGKLKGKMSINDTGGTLRIEMNHVDINKSHENPKDIPSIFTKNKSNDMRILIVAYNLFLEAKGKREVILVTNDLPLRIKADTILGMKVQSFWNKGSIYSGLAKEFVSEEIINTLHESKEWMDAPANLVSAAKKTANHAFILSSSSNPTHTCIALYSEGKIKRVNNKLKIMGVVEGRSVEQKIALNYLIDDSKKVLSLGGKAGTGKTLMTTVAAIEQVAERPRISGKQQFNKIVIIRPMYAVGGQDIGFLPGDANDKMEPWRKAVYDSVEGIVDPKIMAKLQEDAQLDVIPATFIRGRTFHNTFVIVDEAQNFEPLVLLTILTRLGEGSKLVFLWDAAQKDNGKLGQNDGIISVVDKLKGNPMFAHISLTKSHRSAVAELAANILEDYVN